VRPVRHSCRDPPVAAGEREDHITEANPCALGCEDQGAMWDDPDWITLFYDYVDGCNRGEVQGPGLWPQITSASLYRYDDADRLFGLSRGEYGPARDRLAEEAARGRLGADGLVAGAGTEEPIEAAPCDTEPEVVADLDTALQQPPSTFEVPVPALRSEFLRWLAATGAEGEVTQAKWDEWFAVWRASR